MSCRNHVRACARDVCVASYVRRTPQTAGVCDPLVVPWWMAADGCGDLARRVVASSEQRDDDDRRLDSYLARRAVCCCVCATRRTPCNRCAIRSNAVLLYRLMWRTCVRCASGGKNGRRRLVVFVRRCDTTICRHCANCCCCKSMPNQMYVHIFTAIPCCKFVNVPTARTQSIILRPRLHVRILYEQTTKQSKMTNFDTSRSRAAARCIRHCSIAVPVLSAHCFILYAFECTASRRQASQNARSDCTAQATTPGTSAPQPFGSRLAIILRGVCVVCDNRAQTPTHQANQPQTYNDDWPS